jgi:hypothetical protein
MRKSDAYPSKFFKASSFAEDWTLQAEIETARMEEFDSDRGKGKTSKMVVYFRKIKSGLVAGPTVWDQIAEATGEEDTADWPGHVIELYRDETHFAGKTVACIRVRKPEAVSSPKKAPKKPVPASDDLNDELPEFA